MDGHNCTCGAYYEGECGCGADWENSELWGLRSEVNALKAELAEARKDVARMDVLETLKCWIGVFGEWDVDTKFAAGEGFHDTVREVCDVVLRQRAATPPVDTQ